MPTKKAPPIDPERRYTLNLDFDDFDLGELEDLVEHTGVNVMGTDVTLDVKMLRVIVWILERRDHPARTLEECRRVKLSQFDFVKDDADPKA